MLPGERLVGGLTCSEVLENLSGYLDGELDPPRRTQVESHVSACQMCASFGAEFARMLEEVRARMSNPEPLAAEVEARLRAVLRDPSR